MNARLIIKTMTGQLYRQTKDQTNQEKMNITVVFVSEKGESQYFSDLVVTAQDILFDTA